MSINEQLSAESTLPLRTIEVTLDGAIMVTGIIDSGCQGCYHSKGHMGKTWNSMKHEQVMFMEWPMDSHCR